MASRLGHLASRVKNVLSDRMFTEAQIEKVLPNLHEQFFHEPEHLAQIVDTWNNIMRKTSAPNQETDSKVIPGVAKPPKGSIVGKSIPGLSINTILAEIEPDLLNIDPQKLIKRHERIRGLGLINSIGEDWTVLFNAPRGWYLQDWVDLTKKVYYVENRLIDFMYDKREQKDLDVHPLVKSASVVEAEFDHIRTRYLFALRSGYKNLSHLYKVQHIMARPDLTDLILSAKPDYLKIFTPYCSDEEYHTFAKLIKNGDIDEDDAEVFQQLAELNSLR